MENLRVKKVGPLASSTRPAATLAPSLASRSAPAPQGLPGLAFGPIRRKLAVGRADSAEEHTADQIADDVVAALKARSDQPTADGADRHSDGGGTAAAAITARRAAGGSGDASGGGPAPDRVRSVLADAPRTGRPLSGGLRQQFEPVMGADFGGVRVHSGPEVAAASMSISAKAFTVGSDIFFRDGSPDTSRAEGQSLMAHELAHTLEPASSAIGRVRRVLDPATQAELTVSMIEDPAATKEQLLAWRGLLDWEDDALADAIKLRLTAMEAKDSEGAAQLAAQKLLKATAAAEAKAESISQAAKEALAKRQADVEEAVGNKPLLNYVEAIDVELRKALTPASAPMLKVVGSFFLAAATAEPTKTAQQVFDALRGDQVALESFIYSNGGINMAAPVPTTIADAQQVSVVWGALGDQAKVLAALDSICAQLVAGRIKPVYFQYRAAALTSTAGSIYYFARPESSRARAKAELHLHPGKKGDLNNAGFKNKGAKLGSTTARAKLTPMTYGKIKDAIGDAWVAD
jgi:hypothetical protein